MRFERRAHVSPALAASAPLIAVAASLILAGGLIKLSGASVFEAYARIAVGALGSRLAITETLTRATPLILTGLAVAVAFRVRIWNIGAEGQLYIGALAATALGARIGPDLPGAVAIPVLMATGAVAGALYLLAPLALRLRFGVDEVVTTLLLNFVAALLVSMMVEGPLRDPLGFGWPQSVAIADAANLPKLVARSRLHIGFALAIGLALVVALAQSRSLFGFESRAAGLNPAAARFAGIPLRRLLLTVACLSGGLAGLAGAVEVMGVRGYLTTDLSPGFGYTGIVVAMLGELHPIGVILSALFVAALFIGADGMSRALGVPSFIADVIVSLSLLTMLVARFGVLYRVRR